MATSSYWDGKKCKSRVEYAQNPKWPETVLPLPDEYPDVVGRHASLKQACLLLFSVLI